MRKDWEVKKLGDICYSLNGLWTGKNPPFVSVSVIRNTNFSKDCKLVLNDVAIIEVERNQYLSRKLIYGDIIIEKSGGSDKQPVGRPVIFKVKEGEYSFSNFTSTLRVVDKGIVYSDFLYYQLKFFYFDGRTLKMQNKTTGLRNLQLNAYLNQRILLPPIQTQHLIVEELDSLTSIIEKQKKQLEELDNLAQSIFYDMFGDPIENERGWDSTCFGDLFLLRSGNSLPAKKQIPGDFKVYGGNGINGTHVEFNREGEYIIIGRVGAYCGNVRIAKGAFWLTDNAFELIQVKEIQNTIYLLYLLRVINLFRYANKAAQPVISNVVLRDITIPLPPLSLQQKFASKIEAIEKQKELIKKSIKETEDLFNSRMDYYFN